MSFDPDARAEEAPWKYVEAEDAWYAMDAAGNWVIPDLVDPATLIQDKTYDGLYPSAIERFSAGGGELIIVRNKFTGQTRAEAVVMQSNLASLSEVEREEYKRTFGVYPGES